MFGKAITCGKYNRLKDKIWKHSDLVQFLQKDDKAYDRSEINTT